MNNEEKIKEIVREQPYAAQNDNYATMIEYGATKMAEWKDKQFKEFKNLVKEFLLNCDMKHFFKNVFWPIELQEEIEKYL